MVLAVLVLLVASLGMPAVRRRLRPTWRFTGGVLAVLLVVAGVVVVLPDGALPIPPGPGLLVTPSYVGAPAQAQPLEMQVPEHPFLAANGSSSMHDDAWASDSYTRAGPLGESPEVDTAWYGIEECATLAFTAAGDLVALCGDVQGPTMHLIDPGSLEKIDSFEPPRPARWPRQAAVGGPLCRRLLLPRRPGPGGGGDHRSAGARRRDLRRRRTAAADPGARVRRGRRGACGRLPGRAHAGLAGGHLVRHRAGAPRVARSRHRGHRQRRARW